MTSRRFLPRVDSMRHVALTLVIALRVLGR
jgi:hypothetical protein